jgi:hypothetical protein
MRRFIVFRVVWKEFHGISRDEECFETTMLCGSGLKWPGRRGLVRKITS